MKKNNPADRFSEMKQEIIKRDHEVEKSLRTIYAGEEGGMPDMTRLEKIKSHGWLMAAIGIPLFIILLCGAAWAGLFFFKSFNGFQKNSLILSVEGPSEITLGEETTYFINYFNPLKEPFDAAEVRANFPADFIVTQVLPQVPDKNLIWKLGAVAGEEKGTITIKGRFTGALATISAIQAVATYRPANYSNDLETLATKQITYTDSILEGTLALPEKAIPGDRIDLVYRLKNKGVDALGNLEARLTLPEGFSLENSTGTQAVLENRIYKTTIPSLLAGSSTDVIASGVFASGFGGQAKIMAQAGNLSANGTFMPAQTAEGNFPVLAGDLNIKLVVNGSDDAERTVGYGDSLQCSIGYENTANEPLKGITLRLVLEGLSSVTGTDNLNLVDWGKLKNMASSTIKGDSLVWEGSRMPALKEIAPRGDGSIEIGVPIIASASVTGTAMVRATVYADIEQIGDSKIKRTIQITPVIFRLKSDAKLSAEARYYSEEGAPIGSGPLPPKVGQATRYRIFWTVNKSIHSLKDMDVSAVLPRNVNFINLVTSTAGELSYDQNTRRVAWQLNRLPEGVNTATMEFDIELTPVASDDGKYVELVGESRFQAFDENINQSILQTAKALNTDLQNDDSAKGKGAVRK
jgi:hypothetical protein